MTMRPAAALVLSLIAPACAFDESGLEPEPEATSIPDAASCRRLVGIGAVAPERSSHLWSIGPDGPAMLWDQPGETLTLSPDRSRVAFARPYAVHVVDLLERRRTIVPVDGTPRALDWRSRDLAALIDVAGTHTIASIDPVRIETRTVVTSADSLDEARLAPDGRRAGVLRGGQLWTVPLDGGDATRIGPWTALRGFSGWSADGKHLAVTRRAHGSDSLLILGTGANSDARALELESADRIAAPRWSPAGDRIAFLADHPLGEVGAGPQLVVARADGSELHVLSGRAGIRDVSWSAADPNELSWLEPLDDGSTAAFVGDARTGAAIQVARGDWQQVRVVGRCD